MKSIAGSASVLLLAVLFSAIVMSLVYVTGSEVLYARLLEHKAAQRLHIEECLDAAEYIYNSTGTLVSTFSGCSFQWTPTQVMVTYESMERAFAYDKVQEFAVQARNYVSIDKDALIRGHVYAHKIYLYGDSLLLFSSPYKGVQTTWKNQVSGLLFMDVPQNNVIMIGWKSRKTTY